MRKNLILIVYFYLIKTFEIMSEKIEKEIILANPSNKKYHFIYKGNDKQIIIRNEEGEDFVGI